MKSKTIAMLILRAKAEIANYISFFLQFVHLTRKEDKRMNFKLLKQLYSIHSKSGHEEKIIHFIYGWIRRNVPEALIECDNETGNLYITKGESETYPCLVAHMDQVQVYHPKDFVAVETRDIIFGYSKADRKQCGLGGDDKNGLWVALKCLKKFPILKCAFFVGEEVGCVGSEQARMKFFENVRFVIEPDRRGHSDLITEISYMELCSKEFINAIKPEKYGYIPQNGMMTDVEQLKENGLEVSCINLSCGYYEPHTDREFTSKTDLLKCLHFVEHIIADCTDTYPHVSEFDGGYLYGDDPFLYDDCYDEVYDLIYTELTLDSTLEPMDVYEKFKNLYPRLNKEQFAMVYEDAKAALEYFSTKKK